MIAAGVLLTGLAFTAGRADAATSGLCTIDALPYQIEADGISADTNGRCLQGGALVSTPGSGLTAAPTTAPTDPAPTIAPVPTVPTAPVVGSPPLSDSPTTTPAPATTVKTAENRPAAAPPAAAVPAATPPAAVVPAAPLPAAPLPALGVVPAAGLPAPLNLGAPLPSGLASGLFTAGAINPALLSGGSPLPAAALGLYPPGVGSAVDTVSSAKALLNETPRGLGTPTAVAAIMLICIAAVAIRHRILARLRRDSALAPHHPGDEPIEDLDEPIAQYGEPDGQPTSRAQYA